MDYAHIHHESSIKDCYSMGDNRFIIKVKATQGIVNKLSICVCDKYLNHISSTTLEKTILKFPLKKAISDNFFDYYEVCIFEKVICFCYYFEIITTKKEKIYYGSHHFSNIPFVDPDDMFECSCVARYEDRTLVPKWAQGAVGYQIFPDSFARLSKTDVGYASWNKAPLVNGDMLGGEISGIAAHLQYLKELGVDFIYLNPIFKSQSSHHYDTVDYFAIDNHLGSKKDVIKLVKKAHKLGMRVVLDGVFNHVSKDFFAFKDVIKKQEKSRYKDWFYIENFPLRFEANERPNFETFGYFNHLPKLNTSNHEVRKYILKVLKYWTKVLHVDGWRLDVGDEISHSFWKDVYQTLKEINPDILLVGESWKLAADYLCGREWDSVMNYPFYFALNKWLVKDEYKVTDFANDIALVYGTYHKNTRHAVWNMIDSHDTPRFISKCAGIHYFMLAVALQMTLPGTPVIYYGDEVGLEGLDNIDSRRGMLWDEAQNTSLLEYYKKLIEIRFQHLVLKDGDYRLINAYNRNQVLIYARFNDKEEIKIIINASEEAQNCPLKGIDLLTNKEVKAKIPAKTAYIVLLS